MEWTEDGMNYYRRFPGDYQRDTGLLSLAEHGAYGVLMDHYYSVEAPLPAALLDLYRVARAMTEDEQRAVASVADKFFPVGGDGKRHNKRCDEEIQFTRTRSETARNNGKNGGRPPSDNPYETENETHDKPTGLSNGNQELTREKALQTPDSISQNPKASKAQTPAAPVDGLDLAVWEIWLDYRKQIRKPLKPVSFPAAQRELAAFGSEQAVVVEHSIANGWQGLFAPKNSAVSRGTKNKFDRTMEALHDG